MVAAALLVLGVLGLSLTPVRTDHDMWWHLKTGRLIAENGFQLPETDPFTYGSEGVEWHNHEWLTQVLMYLTWKIGSINFVRQWIQQIGLPAGEQAGAWLLVLAKALLLVATFALLARTIWKSGVCAILACLVALLAAMASQWSIHVRPPIISYLFLSILVGWLGRHWHRRHPAASALFVLFLFALWSNMHGGWLAGLVLLGARCAGDLIWLLWHGTKGQRWRRALDDQLLKIHVMLLACALLGTLINPYGHHLYELTWRVMSATELIRLIPEMQPPPFPEHWPLFLLLALAAGALAASLFKSGIASPGEALAVLFFGWQGASHARHAPLFAIVAALPIGRFLEFLLQAALHHRPSRVAATALLAVTLLFTLLISFLGPVGWRGHLVWAPYWPRNAQWARGLGYQPFDYQHDAVQVLLAAQPRGRLWTNLNIGGYMIWRLSPERYLLYTDSRFDVHGDSRQRLEMSINGVGPGGGVPNPDWEAVLAGLQVNVVVLEKPTPLVRALYADSDWTPVHETSTGPSWENGTLTFIRRTPANEQAIERALRAARVLDQLPQPPPA